MFSFPSPQYAGYFIVAYWALVAIVHIALTAAVYQDGSRRVERGTSIVLAPLTVWALATLVGGLLPAFAYWAVNASTLRPPTATE